MRVDAHDIFFRKSDVDPDCSCGALRKIRGYDVRGKHLPRVSPSTGPGEAFLSDTSGDRAWCVMEDPVSHLLQERKKEMIWSK